MITNQSNDEDSKPQEVATAEPALAGNIGPSKIAKQKQKEAEKEEKLRKLKGKQEKLVQVQEQVCLFDRMK
jgi:outer membrane lipoprotein SlyB